MDEKLKSKNMQKRAVFLCLCYILKAIKAGRCRERRYAEQHIYSDRPILQNAPFRSQIFKKKFRLRRQDGIDPLTKILRTFLALSMGRH